MTDPEANDLPERHLDLLMLAAAPAVWAAHFMLSYATAAIWCAKASAASFATVRIAIAIYSVIAVAGIVTIGLRGWRQHALAESATPHDFDSRTGRHRFLGFATSLLAGLSLIAILYATLVVVWIGDCR